MKPEFYLFDLDGTLLDSAPDLAASALHMLEKRGLPPVPFEVLRRSASSGARGLLGAAFGITPDAPGYLAMAEEFLDHYADHLTDNLKFFDGVPEVLREIEVSGKKWGVVTNKHLCFARPAIDAMGMDPDVLICGDTLNKRKPSPEPILKAMELIGGDAAKSVYVGDDIRDIKAAHAAGCPGLAANWGYLGCAEPIEKWNADKILLKPSDLLAFEYPA